MGGEVKLTGPDLANEGVLAIELGEGQMIGGHANGEAVLIARAGGQVYAIGATCTHYGGPLAEGILTGDHVRCPWHHAQFCLKDGSARAPALNPVACFAVETRGHRLFVAGKVDKKRLPVATTAAPKSVVIVGAGAAGACAAEELRDAGYDGPITLVGADASDPVDRPNLSKDYLAGNAPEEWIPLRGRDFYADKKIDARLGVAARAIDVANKRVALADGSTVEYDALLLATGATPSRLSVPGADLPHVRYLRSLDDSRAIIARAADAKRAVVIGASFIGLEAAASLRARGLEVHVVAPDARPLERVLGPDVGDFVKRVHEEHGVVFHLGDVPQTIDAREVELKSGGKLAADLVVVGVGVRPNVALAEAAGLTVDNGIVVDERLRTSAPGIFAAGDVARYPDPHTGERIRIEHWVVAERQGQAAARSILGVHARYRDVPFFWSNHYDVAIAYVGHAGKWDVAEVAGSLADRNAIVAYRVGGAIRAVATIGRDRAALEAEAAFERGDAAAIEGLLR